MHRRAISWISKREHLRIFRLAQTGLSRPGNMTTAKNKEENFIKNDLDKVKGYDYPFTNIVMEGGGSKGMAYVGALEVKIVEFIEVLIPSVLHRSYSEHFEGFPGNIHTEINDWRRCSHSACNYTKKGLRHGYFLKHFQVIDSEVTVTVPVDSILLTHNLNDR